MKLSKNQLVALIAADYFACEARGLAIDQGCYGQGVVHERVTLPAYGTADRICVCYHYEADRYYLQVLHVCPGLINAAAYRRARRYAVGLQQSLAEVNAERGTSSTLTVASVLIGAAVERSSVVYSLGSQHRCRTFCYRFGADGLWFEQQHPMRVGRAGAQLRLWEEASETLVVTATGIIDRRESSTSPMGTDGAE